MASSSSSSSTPAPQATKYDVFLSFRGEDTRYGFTSYLYDYLRRAAVNTFMDDQLVRGKEILSLLKTINESKISIIVFSENYADSRWCLQELEEIFECKRKYDQIVIPIFYKVDPSDVRKQTGSFKSIEKFQNKESPDRVKRWRDALKEAANLSGYTINNEKPEFEVIDEIVGNVEMEVAKLSASNNVGLIGVKSAIESIESLLRIGAEGVFAVGILGIGGIGKTTISSAVFDKIWRQFEGSYFAENVSEKCRNNKLSELQKELLSKVLKDKNSSMEHSSNLLRRLQHMKVLIVFDDVTNYFQQVEKLIGSLNNLGSGSRIIITTREKQVLNSSRMEVANMHEIQGLCPNDALQLYSKYAFGKNFPIKDYEELSNRVVNYTQGVPLALKVFGSHLCGLKKDDWEIEIKNLEKVPHMDIQKVLKISYDRLDDRDKSIFLDIACFLKGWKRSLVQDMLDEGDSYTRIGLNHLHNRCLITISSNNTITMHDLLQHMGKEIVRRECMDNSGKCNRLWLQENVCKVLRKNKKNEEVEGVLLDVSKIGDKTLSLHALAKMHNLKLFKAQNSRVNNKYQIVLHGFEDLKSFSTDLRYFSWDGYPMKSLPSTFSTKNLVTLEMPFCKVEQLWNGVQDLRNLKYIDLRYSKHLKEMPDLSRAVNLQTLLVSYCASLLNFPGVVHSKYITLFGCSELMVAPTISQKVEELNTAHTPIKQLPFTEDYQPKLVRLNLSCCENLESLSSSIYNCESLEKLFLVCCRKLQLPDDFGQVGDLEMCSSNLRPLKHLHLSYCRLRELPKNIGLFSSLQVLSLTENRFERIPDTIKDLCSLHVLIINGCKMLRSLPELPTGVNVEALDCLLLESISDSSFLFSNTSRPHRVNFSACYRLNLSEILLKESPRKLCSGLCYPGNQIPNWFSFRNHGCTIILKDPPDWSNKNFLGFNIGVALASSQGESIHGCDYEVRCYYHIKSNDGEIRVCQYALRGWLNYTERVHHELNGMDRLVFFELSNHVILGFANRIDQPHNKGDPQHWQYRNVMRSNEALIVFDAHGYEVKECGVQFFVRPGL